MTKNANCKKYIAICKVTQYTDSRDWVKRRTFFHLLAFQGKTANLCLNKVRKEQEENKDFHIAYLYEGTGEQFEPVAVLVRRNGKIALTEFAGDAETYTDALDTLDSYVFFNRPQ